MKVRFSTEKLKSVKRLIKSYNYCNVLLDTNDLGSVLVKESENDVVIIGLMQKHQTDDKKAVYLDLFGLDEWLNSNAVSQITK